MSIWQHSQETSLNWNTGNIPGGTHSMRLQVSSAAGVLLAEDRISFTILSLTGLSGAISMDSYSYTEGETAALVTVTVTNLSTNASAENVTYELVISGPDGTALSANVDTIPEILISSSVTREAPFAIPAGVTGTYQAELKVYYLGVVVYTISESFEVTAPQVAPVTSATGTVSVSDRKIGSGAAISFDYSVTNSGSVELTNASAGIELISPSRALLIQTIPITVTLAPGETASDTVSLTELSESLDYYMALLTITIDGSRSVLAQTGFEIGDTAPPAITLTSPSAPHYKRTPLTISAEVTDDIKGVKTLEFMITGKTIWLELTLISGNELDGIYTTAVDTSAYDPGTYGLNVRATDNDDNVSLLATAITVHDIAEISLNETVVPRVLVWSRDDDDDDNTSDVYDETFSGAIANEPEHVRFYLKVLKENGYDFKIVQLADTFLSELRSGYYNLFIINDEAEDDNGALFATATEKSITSELKELVNSGSGAIISNYIRYDYDVSNTIIADAALEELIGALVIEVDAYEDFTLHLSDSALSTGFTAETEDHPVVVVPTVSQIIGLLTDDDDDETIPGVLLNSLGNGKTVFISFNLAESAEEEDDHHHEHDEHHHHGDNDEYHHDDDDDDDDDDHHHSDNVFGQFLLNCMSYLSPASEEQYTGATVSFSLDIDVFETSTLKLEVLAPAGTQGIVPYNNGILSGDTITWEKSYIADDTDNLRFALTLPQTTGTYDLSATASYDDNGSYVNFQPLTLTLDLTATHESKINEAISMINLLTLPTEEEAARTALTASLSTIAGTTATDQTTLTQLITDLISDIAATQTLTADTTGIRLKLDTALKMLLERLG